MARRKKNRTKKRARTFLQWLSGQTERDDPVGDFARDAQADPDKPTGSSVTEEEFSQYLVDEGAGVRVLRAFWRAWDEWQAAEAAAEAAGDAAPGA